MAHIRSGIGLSFDDVLLVPQRGTLDSRDKANIHSWAAGAWGINIPICSSPMSTVTEWEMARRMSELGGVGFIHRFMSVEDQVEHYGKATTRSQSSKGFPNVSETHWAGCAIGISEGYGRINKLFVGGCRLYCIDIAHGHSESTATWYGGLDAEIKHHSTFVSGSIATAEGATFLVKEVGLDALRVGIGNGSACSTRESTGAGVPQITALMEISEAVKGLKSKSGMPIRIISCGGIRNAGDIVKALASGADSVMCGNLLAGADESPQPGTYYGEASGVKTRFRSRYIEGVAGTVEPTGGVAGTIEKLVDGIRSGISYCGATSIKSLREKAEFIQVAPGVKEESRTRIS